MMQVLYSFCFLCVFHSLAFKAKWSRRTSGWSLCSTHDDDFSVFHTRVLELKDSWNGTPIPTTENIVYDSTFTPSFAPEPNDEIVLEVTKRWVQAMIADFAVCPFTVESNRAGIPRGAVRYTVSRATTLVEAFQAYWEEAHAMAQASTKEISTVLLIFPEVSLFGYDYTQFDRYSQSLEETLAPENPLGFDTYMNNVYFHPEFKFKDKFDQVHFIFNDEGEVIGTTEDLVLPHNYARRSPWPIINILRTPMVKAAQKGIPEGRVFSTNEERLNAVGSDVLQAMLEQKNWQGLPIHSPYAMRQLSEIGRSMNARGGDVDDDMWEKDLQIAGYYLPDGESLETLEERREEMFTVENEIEENVEESDSNSSNSLQISKEVPEVIQWTMDVEPIDDEMDTPEQPHTHNTHTNLDQEQLLLIALSWTSVFDAVSGSIYYVNSVSGTSQWESPIWLTEKDPTTGLMYYVNTVTGVSQWENPTFADIPELAHAQGQGLVETQIPIEPLVMDTTALPIDWMVVTDEITGDVYYANTVTGITQWDRPSIL